MNFSVYKLYEPFDLTQYKNTRFMYNPNTKQIILGSFHDDISRDSHADLYYTATEGNKGYDNFYIKGWLGFGGRKYQKGIIHFAPNIRPEQSEVVMEAIALVEKLKNHGFTDNTWVRGLVRFDEYKIKDMYEKIQNWQDDVRPYTQQLQDWVNCSFVKDKVYKIAEGVYTSDKMKARYHNSDLKPYFLLIDSPFYSNGKLSESFSNLSKKGFNGIIQGKTFRVFNESEQVKEANAQKDNEIREKVRNIFLSLVKSIQKNPNIGEIVGTKNGYGYFINITQALKYFYPDYNSKPLYVLIKSADRNYGMYSKTEDYNIIIMNILSENQMMEMATKQENGKKSAINQFIKKTIVPILINENNTFIHEFIHALDNVRLKNYKGRKESQLNITNTQYLSDPLEFNAWFQSNIYDFDKDANNEPELKRNWKLFYSYVLDCLPFVKEYDEKYRRKFDVRLWKYWNEFIKDGGKKEVSEAKFNYDNLYHGTNASFDVFNKEYITGGYLGKGFYFTMSKNMAKNYGKNVIEVKLNYNNSFMFDSDVLDDNSLIKILNTSNANDIIKKDIFNRYKNLVNGYSIYEANSKLFDLMDFYKGDTTKILKELGYDSIDNIERDSEFLVFEPAQIKIIKQVNESLKNEGGFFITSSGRDILNLLQNKPKEYRIVYDANLKLFMICDANEGIHADMLEKAYNNGLYYNLEDFIDSLGSFQNYIETGQDGGWDENDNEINSFLYYMVFDPTGQWEIGDDDYDTVYKLPFGNLFTRKCDLSEIPFYNMLPLTERLNEYDEFDSNDDFWKQDEPKFNDNFWKWFNGSKVVDEDGSPLIVYHGTASKFDVFGDSKFGDYGKGYYFVDSKLKANEYAIRSGGNVIMSAYLSIKNPYIARSSSESQLRSDIGEKFTKNGLPIKKEKITEILSQNGYDGVIIPIGEQPFGFNYYLCFNKNQIKSVDNNGNWSSASDNVNEVIEEGVNDNYLYHAMWKKQFLRCKKDNRLYSHTAYENYKTTHRTIKGISTSRNLNVCIKFMERAIKEMTDEWKKDPNSYFLMNDTGNDGTTNYIDKGADLSYVVLVFDRNKLKQNHKIIPHNYLGGRMRDSFGDEQEELVVGDIPNFMNYVIDVIEFNNNINSKTLKSKKNVVESSEPKLNDNFWKWFGDSKCVDEKGNPQLCVHHTNSDFDTFDISKSQSTNLMGNGFYFSTVDNKQLKQNFGKNVKKCYLSIKNPFFAFNRIYNRNLFEPYINKKYLDIIFADNSKIIGMTLFYNLKAQGIEQSELDITEVLKKMGYDGICLKENNIWVAFYPNQIKSVDNNGNWSNDSDNINEVNESVEPNLNQNFWKWFGDSVCVDETGAPLVLYHGTSSNFTKFKKGFIFTTDNKDVAGEYGSESAMPVFVKMSKPFIVDAFNQSFDEIYNAEGFKKRYKDLTDEDIEKLYKAYDYFESIEDCRNYYEENKKYNPDDYINLAKAYGQRAYSTNQWAQYAKNKGYDGCIIKNVNDTPDISNTVIDEYIVWNPNQVKSVENNGEWSDSDELMESLNTRKITVYHGSSDKDLKIKDNSMIFFTNDKEDAKRWAKRQILGGKKNKENYIYKAEITFNNPYIIGDSTANPEYAQYKDITNEIEKEDIYTEIFFDDITNNYQKLVAKGYDCFIDNMIGNGITYYVIPSEFKNNVKWLEVEKI